MSEDLNELYFDSGTVATLSWLLLQTVKLVPLSTHVSLHHHLCSIHTSTVPLATHYSISSQYLLCIMHTSSVSRLTHSYHHLSKMYKYGTKVLGTVHLSTSTHTAICQANTSTVQYRISTNKFSHFHLTYRIQDTRRKLLVHNSSVEIPL